MSAGTYVDHSIRSFLLNLAGRSPEPAGGAALAVAGASAAALLSLACHAAARRQAEHGNVDRTIAECHESTDDLVERIQSLVDEDVRAYENVRRVLRSSPDGSEARSNQYYRDLDRALHRAIDVPVALAEACLEILALAAAIAPSVHAPVSGDLVSAVHLAEAAVKGSLRNARLNAASLVDRTDEQQQLRRIDAVSERFAREQRRALEALSAGVSTFSRDG